MSVCPHPTCQLDVEWDRFACRSHWFSLPVAIRNEIGAAWRARLARKPGAAERHDAAKGAALDYWRAR